MHYYTQEKLAALKKEYASLEDEDIPTASQAVGEARKHGDLSENAEYHAAKERLAHLQKRVNKLKHILAHAMVIDETKLSTDKVAILNKVTLWDKEKDQQFTYQVVSQAEADVKQRKISVDSPIGRSLLGKHKGEVVTVTTPMGTRVYEIRDIQV